MLLSMRRYSELAELIELKDNAEISEIHHIRVARQC